MCFHCIDFEANDIIQMLIFQLINPDEKLYCSGSSGKEERLKKSLENLRQRLQSMQSHTSNGGHLFHLLRCVDVSYDSLV